MAAPFSNLRSKNDRAIVAWLIAQGCGTKDDIFPGYTTQERAYPNTNVNSVSTTPEDKFTGNRRVKVVIHLKGEALNQDGTSARPAFDARVAKTMDNLMLTDDEQTLAYTAAQITLAGRALAVSDPVNNADMADYTCLEWYEAGEGDGEDADSEGCAWHEVLMFECVACPSAIN